MATCTPLEDIPTALNLSALQLLTDPDEIEAATGLPATQIDKDVGLALQWGEVGPLLFRERRAVRRRCRYLGVRFVSLDQLFLRQAEAQAPGSGAGLVSTLKASGFSTMSFTVTIQAEWGYLELLGVESIFTDDIPMGVASQADFIPEN